MPIPTAMIERRFKKESRGRSSFDGMLYPASSGSDCDTVVPSLLVHTRRDIAPAYYVHIDSGDGAGSPRRLAACWWRAEVLSRCRRSDTRPSKGVTFSVNAGSREPSPSGPMTHLPYKQQIPESRCGCNSAAASAETDIEMDTIAELDTRRGVPTRLHKHLQGGALGAQRVAVPGVGWPAVSPAVFGRMSLRPHNPKDCDLDPKTSDRGNSQILRIVVRQSTRTSGCG